MRRVRQSAQDLTPALLAAAAKCPPLPEDWQPPPAAALPAAAPGWLALRVASELPEAAACRNGAELLQLAAATAAAAAPPPPPGAPLVVCGRAAQQGQQAQQGRSMSFEEAAVLLLNAASGARGQSDSRVQRWFSLRSTHLRKQLGKRLAAEGAVDDGKGSGSFGGRAAGLQRRGGRPPSRLQHECGPRGGAA